MALVFDGDGTITGISVGGLPDGIVDTDMLATNAVSAAKLQSTAIAAGDLPTGSILQVKSATKTGIQQYTDTAGTKTDITDLSIDITPTTSGNKLYITGFVSLGMDADTAASILINVGGTEVGSASTAGNRRLGHSGIGYQNDAFATYTIFPLSINYLHTTSGTSQITVKIQMMQGDTTNGDIYVNRSRNDSDSVFLTRQVSTLTVMEVAA